jgi:hypothetical protein
MRMQRINLKQSGTMQGLGSLSEYKTHKEIDDAIAEIDRRIAAGLMPKVVGDSQKKLLTIRRKALSGESTLPAEGTVKVTKNCIVSRIGGNLIISFTEPVDDRLKTACEMQGFVFDTAQTCKAQFSTARYIFALELCGGYESAEKGLDVDAVKNVIARYMETNKIGFDGLTDDVKKAIGSTQKIVIEPAPDMPPVDASEINDIPDFFKIVDDIVLGHNVFLVGPAGSGKTFLAEYITSRLGRTYVTINCSQYTSPTEIKGGPTIEGYQEGALIDCWENGKILILDELPKIDPNTAGLLNEALAKTKVPVGSDRAIIYNGRNEPKNKKQGFGVIATGNVFPTAESATYTANSRQDLSLLDRFSGSVYYVGFNDKLEKKQAGSLLVYSVGMRLRQWILDNKVDSTISLRWLETAASVYRLEMDRFENKRNDSDRVDSGKTLKDHVDAVITTFNKGQQDNLRDYMNYTKVFSTYQYRKMPSDKLITWS